MLTQKPTNTFSNNIGLFCLISVNPCFDLELWCLDIIEFVGSHVCVCVRVSVYIENLQVGRQLVGGKKAQSYSWINRVTESGFLLTCLSKWGKRRSIASFTNERAGDPHLSTYHIFYLTRFSMFGFKIHKTNQITLSSYRS